MKNLLDKMKGHEAYDNIIKAFQGKSSSLLYGLSGSQKVFFAALAQQTCPRSFIILVRDKEQKALWERDLAFFLPSLEVYSFPMVDRLHFTATAKSLEAQVGQMSALSALLEEEPVAVIATMEEAAQHLILPDRLERCRIHFKVGEDLDRTTLLERLVTLGYERMDQVEQCGHFSVRGDIVDIYAVNLTNPVRIEFFGDTIDAMRIFSVDTQRSLEGIQHISILPLALKEEESGSLLSYGKQATIIYDEPNRLQEQLKSFLRERGEHQESHYHWADLLHTARAENTVVLSFLQQKVPYLTVKATYGVATKNMVSFERQIPLLMDEIKHWVKQDYTVVLVMNNRQRGEGIERALKADGIGYRLDKEFPTKSKEVVLMSGLISEGFELPHGHYVVVSEGNIFGQQKKKLRKKAAKGQEINYFTDLTIGDYVVHNVHGIGKYIGLKTIETDGLVKDYVEIDYAGTDRLFLPADNLDQLQKYIGNEGETPKLHKMGGGEWQRVKRKAQQSIDDLAEKLAKLYAKREIIEGFAFPPDEPWQEEFEDAFPYEETEDQLQATREIKDSMEQPRPMDRLLCGDVGFGKTEVAMRAVFKAVLAGKQVAVLVPTTILAQQHYQTFFERFSPFGIRVEVLNRFRSAKEKKEVLELTKVGQCNVLIGTHALLSKKVEFKDLGLLVVDEEQRFGVGQKEKWKEWASQIDVLTLSATPIPRTLHMSLVGVREMSVINTPPEERMPVQTYVIEYDIAIAAEAIRREIQRGGQVYFVYNRVASIHHMASLLEAALPDLRFAIAHGQMTGPQIESVMVDFYEGNYDLLLCTSIVENGLDVPNANTIIIYDADRLGLSQLYQMRGRVGRSRRRAYAYFMYRPDKLLTETAEKRLQAIKEFTELGAGFKLAMRDLEIRGAGNLLGSQQHGNIAAVGFAMYCSMLEEALAKAQHKEVPIEKRMDPVIDLQTEAYIDDAYVKDSARKIMLYQRMLHIKSEAELSDFIDEMIDRFGDPTDAVANLLEIAKIKERARLLGIKRISRRRDLLEIQWADDKPMANWDMGSVKPAYWKRMKFLATKPASLRIDLSGVGLPIVTFTAQIMNELERRLS